MCMFHIQLDPIEQIYTVPLSLHPLLLMQITVIRRQAAQYKGLDLHKATLTTTYGIQGNTLHSFSFWSYHTLCLVHKVGSSEPSSLARLNQHGRREEVVTLQRAPAMHMCSTLCWPVPSPLWSSSATHWHFYAWSHRIHSVRRSVGLGTWHSVWITTLSWPHPNWRRSGTKVASTFSNNSFTSRHDKPVIWTQLYSGLDHSCVLWLY